MLDEKEQIEFPELMGKTVGACVYDEPNGYSRLVIVFTDGTRIEANERSQTGTFHVWSSSRT